MLPYPFISALLFGFSLILRLQTQDSVPQPDHNYESNDQFLQVGNVLRDLPMMSTSAAFTFPYYKIFPYGTNACLDVSSTGDEPHGPIVLSTCIKSNPTQEWGLKPWIPPVNFGMALTIYQIINGGAGECLTTIMDKVDEKYSLANSSCSPSEDQGYDLWTLRDADKSIGYYIMENVRSNLCLSRATDSDSILAVKKCDSSDKLQMFRFVSDAFQQNN